MSNMTLIGKDGTAKKYRVSGGAAHADSAPYTGFSTTIDGEDLIVKTGKRELGAVQQWAESLVEKTTETKTNNGERYIELVSVAVEKKLNHGKSWVATADNVDRNSLNPSWEGEKICYVYPS